MVRVSLQKIVSNFIRSASFIGSFNAISNCRFKHIDVNVFDRFKLDAIPRHTRLAYFFAKRSSQVGLVFDAKDVNRYSGFVCTQADLVELS